jgi:hypothetical protein
MWYAFGSEWIQFAHSSMPLMLYMFIHEIILDTKRIAIINSKESLNTFEKNYGFNFHYNQNGEKVIKKYDGENTSYSSSEVLINWPDVVKDFDGVEVYGKGLTRNDWQEYWDIPSGCVWNQSAIKDSRLLYLYNIKTKQYVKPESLGIYAGYSSKIKTPLPEKI